VPFNTAVFTSDGALLLAAEGHKQLAIWNVDKGEMCARVAMGHDSSFEIAISPDNELFATSNNLSDAVRVWLLAARAQILELPCAISDAADCLAWAPQGHRLAYAIDEKTVVVRGIESDEIERRFEHATPLRRLAFTPDGHYLATTSQSLDIWDMRSGRIACSLPGAHTDVVTSPGRSLIAAACGSNVTLVDMTGERPRAGTLVTVGSDVTALAIHQNTLAAAFSRPSAISLWDLRTRQVLLDLSCDLEIITGVAFSPDGRRLVATGSTANKHGAIWEWTIRRKGK
jgi:WD40 repeat protein